MAIQAINNGDIHRITSGQVIIDLTTAVKEALENALDAHSTQVTITFKNHGLDLIEVADNGTGIDESDYDKICLKSYTSKLDTFEDVANIRTLGFRGEAMSSLCAISDVTITTATKEIKPRAYKLFYDRMGNLSRKQVCSGTTGTIIQISNLFESLPVRRIDLTKNSKREFQKVLTFLQSYAVINVGVRIIVQHLDASSKKKSILLSSTGAKLLKNNILSVFGSNGMYGLESINLEMNITSRFKLKGLINMNIIASGYISNCSFGQGRSATDRQLWFINNRPVNLQHFSKAVNEVYKSFNHLQNPVIILNLEIDPQFVDINVTPDKRTVMLHNESLIVEHLKEELNEIFNSQDMKIPMNISPNEQLTARSSQLRQSSLMDRFSSASHNEIKTEVVETVNEKYKDTKKEIEDIELEEGQTQNYNESENESESSAQDQDIEKAGNDKETEVGISTLRGSKKKRNALYNIEKIKVGKILDKQDEEFSGIENDLPVSEDDEKDDIILSPPYPNRAIATEDTEYEGNEYNEPVLESVEEEIPPSSPKTHTSLSQYENDSKSEKESSQRRLKRDNGGVMVITVGDKTIERNSIGSSSRIRFSPEANLKDASTQQEECDCEKRTPDLPEQCKPTKPLTSIRETSTHDLMMPISLTGRDMKLLPFKKRKRDSQSQPISKEMLDDITDQAEAEKKLTLSVSKSDFLKMKVVGQFNLGFILVTRKNVDNDDLNLFIVDQHASDEKFNFERLQAETIFNNQPLVIPNKLELNAIDELAIMNNLYVFEKNGFELDVDEDADPGSRVILKSSPYSKNTIFDLSDFHELVHLVKENEGKADHIRPTKVRAMFAMRACRSSIMIGKHLNMKTMERVVRNLSTLDKPWNCPHGRPTMRHLIELKDWNAFNEDYL